MGVAMLVAALLAVVLSAPPVLPSAFNTSFTMTLPGNPVSTSAHGAAFWAYDAAQGGQYVWHPSCPFGDFGGCALFFAGGYAQPAIFVVTSSSMMGPAKTCCLFAKDVPILPPTTFSKYAFVINTTILHTDRDVSLDVQIFFSFNRQCFVDAAGNLARILDVDTVWDLPIMALWSVGPQPSNLFTPPAVCNAAKSC